MSDFLLLLGYVRTFVYAYALQAPLLFSSPLLFASRDAIHVSFSKLVICRVVVPFVFQIIGFEGRKVFFGVYTMCVLESLMLFFFHHCFHLNYASPIHGSVVNVCHPYQKDKAECLSYRPISLLHIDVKILAKVLARG